MKLLKRWRFYEHYDDEYTLFGKYELVLEGSEVTVIKETKYKRLVKHVNLFGIPVYGWVEKEYLK